MKEEMYEQLMQEQEKWLGIYRQKRYCSLISPVPLQKGTDQCKHMEPALTVHRLGYPSDQVLFMLHQDLDISMSSIISVCEVCYRAKQVMDPFPLSSHKSKHLGELVHLDLWGPYRVPSSFNETNLEDVQTPGVRRSSRQAQLPVKLNDYVLSSVGE
nr:ribonuclease H-like domain-containing protein [Tanacetum cinerariifolium]